MDQGKEGRFKKGGRGERGRKRERERERIYKEPREEGNMEGERRKDEIWRRECHYIQA